jgi:rhodanese-related sulfurtransferase
VLEPEEVRASPIGSIVGSRVMPLRTLRQHLDEIPRDRPIVLVCPAGARSAIAAAILEGAGIERVANMRGGLLEWRTLGLPGEVTVSATRRSPAH